MPEDARHTLAHQWSSPAGSLPFHLTALTTHSPTEPPRTNHFTVAWVTAGSGTFCRDEARHPFAAPQLLFAVPYQHLRLIPDEPTTLALVTFHANFLCVETFHAETGCSGSLFNDPYGLPLVTLDEATRIEVERLYERMTGEFNHRSLGWQDVLVSSTRILLILAARLKCTSTDPATSTGVEHRHPVLAPLRELIEAHYRRLHAPSDYADLLHMTPKALGRCVKEHLGKTLTDLIRERILTHAKWQLLHTLRPVKEIAAELGFRDELYFSRLFKKATGVAPTWFREFETRIRGGSNLSIPSAHAPILAARPSADDTGRHFERPNAVES